MQNNKDNGEVNPPPENQYECDSRIIENNRLGGVEAPSSPPPSPSHLSRRGRRRYGNPD